MRVLNISLDTHLLDVDSVVSGRVRTYGQIVDSYNVVVPTSVQKHVKLADNVEVYGSGGYIKLFRLWRIFRFVWQKAARREIDLITVQDAYFLGLVALLVARFYSIGIEVQIHGLEKTTGLRSLIARFVLRRANLVRVVSKRLYLRLQSEYGVQKERMIVVPIYVPVHKLGFDEQTLNTAEQEKFQEGTNKFREIYKNKFNFLTVSRLVTIKNIDLQLKTIAKLSKNYPEIVLHIVGEGPEHTNLEQQVRALQLEEQVVFHGVKNGVDLGVFYKESDCFLLTSFYEGWGMVIVESGTAGLPVIMTDVGCAGELIVDRESGLVVPVNDSEALLVAMESLIGDTALRQKLSEGIRVAVNKLPDFPDVLQQYKAAWEKIQV